MKKLLPIMLTSVLMACGGGSDTTTVDVTPKPVEATPQPVVVKTKSDLSLTVFNNTQVSWYHLPQWFNGVTKYGGILGTYTAKHRPVAVSCALGKWATYSNNRDGNLSIYAINLDNQSSTLVHTIVGETDPHQNGAIQCGGGKLWLHVSARGNRRAGYLYNSTDGINWDLVEENDKSYPQLHWINNKLVTLFTRYKPDLIHNTGNKREIYSSCTDKVITTDRKAHYMMSEYHNGRLHVVYNTMEDSVDDRQDLTYIYSDDAGCTWSIPDRWYGGTRFVYLKDLRVIGNTPTALVVLSDSADPTQGQRQLFKMTATSHQYQGEANHNYTTGALMLSGEPISPLNGHANYAGGNLYDQEYCNYVRRVWGTEDEYVASCGVSAEYLSDGWLVHIK
jgi:hypothetical protein